MKKLVCAILISILFYFSFIISYAESKTIKLGDTGMKCQVDSKYEIVTSANKKEYSQQIQSIMIDDNSVLLYSSESYYVILFDQGKNLKEYDFSNKKPEEIQSNYAEYISPSSLSNIENDNYEISIYDSGKAKWLKLEDPTDGYVFYQTIQGNKSASVLGFPRAFNNLQDITMTIDSFSFDDPSLWDNIKSAAGKITDFGKSRFGIVGAIITWLVIAPSIIGLIGYALVFIIGIIASIFSKRKISLELKY